MHVCKKDYFELQGLEPDSNKKVGTMKKIWLVLSILTASLCARENPFMPISELNTSVMTTNVVEKYDSFNSLSFKFPSDAMLLLDVTIRYRANDGSIKEKRLTDIKQNYRLER